MASLAQIRAALATTVEAAIADLQCYQNVPEQVNLPCVLVVPRSADFVAAMGRGTDIYQFDLIVLVSRRDDDLAQFDLDEYVTGAGAKSVRQAIFQANTLGLTNTTALVSGWPRYGGEWNVGDVPHVGAALACQVATTGTA